MIGFTLFLIVVGKQNKYESFCRAKPVHNNHGSNISFSSSLVRNLRFIVAAPRPFPEDLIGSAVSVGMFSWCSDEERFGSGFWPGLGPDTATARAGMRTNLRSSVETVPDGRHADTLTSLSAMAAGVCSGEPGGEEPAGATGPL